VRPGTTGKRAIRSGLVISVVLGAQLFVGSLIGTPAGAAGILPPSDPPANIGFDLAPNCTAVDDVSATCIDSLLHDINAGRNSEGVAPMVLPNGFTQMSDEEQILVLANLERGDRGLSQFAGLSSTLIQASGFGALANDDPSPPAGYPFYQWGSNYADSINPLEADFLWMYDDGVGGTNYDCMGSNFTGCWGHRNNILGPWNSNGAQTTEMGDAATATGVYTELFANKAGGADPMVDPYSSVTYPHQVAPQVISVSPTGVTSPGTGTPVTIEGNYFSLYSAGQTPVVDFGSVPATNVHVSWDGTLTADAPANPLGASGDVVAITVTTPAGTSSSTANSSDTFTYSGTPLPTVTSISPSSGSQDGGTQVTITGGNLGLTNVVDFGATPAPTFRINSNSSITATAPPSSTLGPVNVVAKTTVNASSTSSNDLFTYKRDATVTPTVSSNTSSQGASLTYAATVGGNGATPTGTVTFSSGWNIVCTAALVDGTGSCQTSTTPPGSDTITAIYSGDANYVVSSGTVNVVVTSGEYTPLVVPTRICDSRPGNVSKLSGPAAQCNGPSNAGSPIGGGGTKVINVAGSFGVPADATAVVLNVTMVNTTAPGYLTVYPTGTSQPDASNLNYGTGETVPNLVEVATGTNGDVSFYASSQSNIVVDVEGYVSTTASSGAGAGLYDPLPAPVRICDTRANNFSTLSGANTQCNGPGNSGERLSAGGTISVQVAGIDGVPSNVSAVVLNVTVANPSAAGYLTVYPEGASQPTASNVNYAAGETAANRVTVPLSSNGTPGRISIYSSSPTDVVVDISGYYSAAGGTGNQYTTETSPVRICDTRAGNPSQLSGTYAQCFNKPIDPSGNLTLQVAGLAGVPTGAKAVVVNLTAVAPTMPTYLTIYPGPNRTSSSDLNPAAGETRANLSVATINANGTITVYNNTGSVNVVVDVLGWYS
jgi:hypothetical protein